MGMTAVIAIVLLCDLGIFLIGFELGQTVGRARSATGGAK
jgi:hypothetical protein